MSEALEHTKQLKSYESIITREGVCLGNHWIRLTAAGDDKAGLLQREREIVQLQKIQQDTQEQLDKKQAYFLHTQKQLKELEEAQTLQQKHYAELIAQQADLSARQTVQHARINQAKQRIQVIQQELQETKQLNETTQGKLQQTCEEQKIADTQLQQMEKQRLTHLENKESLHSQLNESVRVTKAYEAEFHQLELSLQAADHQLKAELASLSNVKQQQLQLEQRFTISGNVSDFRSWN
jgi:chromosome segregation protein